MLPYENRADSILERKSARMEQRVKPHIKQTIEEAAVLLGIDMAEFVVNEAYRGAEAVLARQEITRMTPEDRALILALLSNTPPPPPPALISLMEMSGEIDV